MAHTVALVAAPSHWSPADLSLAETIVRNAIRLLDDASLLQTYERWGTAHTLSTIALEEAGKVALRCWTDNEKTKSIGRSWTFHVRKQAAAACLLLADVAKRLIDDHPTRKDLSTFEKGTEEDEDQLRHDLAYGLQSSRANRLLELIALQAVERSKQVGFYVDDWGIAHNLTANMFKSADATASMDEARLAVRLLRSRDHRRIAKAIFELDPLRPDYLAAGRRALFSR